MMQAIFSWATLYWIIMPIYLIACIGLIIFVLLQKGKGGGFAGAFGGAGTEAVFGPRSSSSLPQRITYTMAGLFMVLSLILSMLSGKVTRGAAPALVVEGAEFTSSIDRLFDPNAVPVEPEAAAGDESTGDVVETVVETTPIVIDGAVTESAPAVEESAPAEEAPAPEAASTEADAAPEAAPAPEADAATDAPTGDEEAPAAS